MITTNFDGSIDSTPGNFFSLLFADPTLNCLYGNENSIHYEAVADRLGFLSTARTFGLESPLGASTHDGGYFVYINRDEWAELVGERDQPVNILPEKFKADPVWQCISAFADKWHTGKPPFNMMTQGLWFEIDVSGPPPAVPVPSIFFGVKSDSADSSSTAILDGLEALDMDLPSAQRDLLIEYLRRIGPLCGLFQIGLMLSRPASPLRLCAFKADVPTLMHNLRELGITALDDHPDFPQAFFNMGLHCSAIDIDIGSSFGTKVGVEFKFQSPPTIREQRQKHHWPVFLEWLVNKGWCLPPKDVAVLNWIGGHRYQPNPYDFGVPQAQKLILRTISHIKIDFQPSLPPGAKAYLEYVVR